MSRPPWVPADVDTPARYWCDFLYCCDARRGPNASTHCLRPARHPGWHCGQAASGSWWQWPPDPWPPNDHDMGGAA